MPRFYFHLDDGQHIEDHAGNELADLDEAKQVAQLLIQKFMQLQDMQKKWFIVVTDENGAVVHNAYPAMVH